MITISGTLSKGWMARALGVTFDRDYYFDPQRRYAIDCRCYEYAAKQFPGLRLFYSESNLGQIDYWDKNQILIGGIQPNMILGMLLGADFIPQDHLDADISPGCLIGKDVDDLPDPVSLIDSEWIKLFAEMQRNAAAAVLLFVSDDARVPLNSPQRCDAFLLTGDSDAHRHRHPGLHLDGRRALQVCTAAADIGCFAVGKLLLLAHHPDRPG